MRIHSPGKKYSFWATSAVCRQGKKTFNKWLSEVKLFFPVSGKSRETVAFTTGILQIAGKMTETKLLSQNVVKHTDTGTVLCITISHCD